MYSVLVHAHIFVIVHVTVSYTILNSSKCSEDLKIITVISIRVLKVTFMSMFCKYYLSLFLRFHMIFWNALQYLFFVFISLSEVSVARCMVLSKR